MDWNELRQKKQVILDDMMAAIRYTPNREADLLTFMRLYIKEDPERRAVLLRDLRACMDGEPYPNPYAGQFGYTQEHVDRCGQALEQYLTAVRENGPEAGLLAEDVIDRLNQLDESCGGSLIDDWRGEKLRRLIDAAAELASQGCALEPKLG